jgi:aminopeptidase-like protein/aminoglycoside N3'-acetyltransferase
MRTRFHYRAEDAVRALREAGLEAGDVVFCHAGLLKFGFPAEMAEGLDAFQVALNALREVLGPGGSVLTPTFSYSFCKGEVFDPLATPSAVGSFGENLRKLPEARRSLDPIFSVAGIGPGVAGLFHKLPHDCFGEGCLYDRLGAGRAKLLLLGVDFEYCTALHHLEQTAGAPHRFRKLFTGHVRVDGRLVKQSWLYFVRAMAEACEPRLERAGAVLAEAGVCREAGLGLGKVTCVDFADLNRVIGTVLAHQPGFFAADPTADPMAAEAARSPRRSFEVKLPEAASMEDILRGLWHLPRDIVSDGFSTALKALARQIPLRILRFPTGSECFTWIVPERWTCREARLETLEGRVLFTYADNPLHVVSYSLPFRGEVTREELSGHLHTHPDLEEAIPYVYKYYERDWGLCCSRRMKDELTDERYRVVIDTDFSMSALEVGEWELPGVNPEEIVICAHLCHPGQAVDDLSGVVVAVEVMRRLAARPSRRFTYRLLLTPETVGSAAWLSRHEHLTPRIMGGLFLEMLGAENPHALQHSILPDSRMDVCAELAVREHDPQARVEPFLGVVLNDERMFNAPGVRKPMVSLSRARPSFEGKKHYAYYHSSLDTADNVNYPHLEASLELAMAIIDTLEADRIPRPLFKGELFCSRFSGMDYASMGGDIFKIMFQLDGRRRVSDITRESGLRFGQVREYLDILASEGLIEWD